MKDEMQELVFEFCKHYIRYIENIMSLRKDDFESIDNAYKQVLIEKELSSSTEIFKDKSIEEITEYYRKQKSQKLEEVLKENEKMQHTHIRILLKNSVYAKECKMILPKKREEGYELSLSAFYLNYLLAKIKYNDLEVIKNLSEIKR